MKKFVNIDVLKQNELEKEKQIKINGGTNIIPPLSGVIVYNPKP